MQYFTVTWPDPETRIQMFLYNVGTQELFQERRIWDRVCLKTFKMSNIQ